MNDVPGSDDRGEVFTPASPPTPRDPEDPRAAEAPDDPDAEAASATRDALELQSQASDERKRSEHDSVTSFLKELPVLLLIAFGLAFLLRTFAVQVFYIPSASMHPTLLENDRIVVEKLSYRFGDVERGDVVVFAGESPMGTPEESGVQKVVRGVGQFLGVVPVDARDLVKRVIGLPGDEVVMTDGIVTVNGTELDEPYAMLDADDGTWEVPEGQLFVLGDNRNNSADSRSSLGFIEVDDVVGRAIVKIWPLDRFGSVEGGEHGDVPDSAPAGTGMLPLAAVPVTALVVNRRAA